MYRHTQTGNWIIVIFGTIAVALIIIALFYPGIYQAYILAFGLMATLFLFASLTVIGNDDQLSFYFGIGLLRKQFRYADLKSIRKVRNKWYWGWGIRWFGRGWLYNVAGLDAIELILKNGKVVRIGTNEPDTLMRFVEARLKA